MATTTEITYQRACDLCGATAHYDAKTTFGPWANLCQPCYQAHRAYTTLGTGKGQRLVLATQPISTMTEEVSK